MRGFQGLIVFVHMKMDSAAVVHSGAVEARSAAISLRPVPAPCIPEATVRMGTAERKFAEPPNP